MSLPQSTHPSVSALRARQEILHRFNPLRNLTPQNVVRVLEDYDRGVLREAAWMMDKVERTDDMTRTVALKRKKALGRLNWSIRPYESWESIGSAENLERQTALLRHLYNSLRVTHALERNTRGGIQTLVVQMADAIGKGYAAHELLWRPTGNRIELEAIFVPLHFFENTTGRLRFLPPGRTTEGEELAQDAWMVTVGDGLMVATLVAYIYKTLPLKDWLVYSERNGMPFAAMATDATFGSKEWEDARTALASVGPDYAALHSRNAEFQIHDMTAKGQLPYPPLVERMDRAIAMLWRGSDLSTMSGEDKVGASLQQSESDILIEDDVQMINETLEHSISLPALKGFFGEDVRPMCYFALHAPDRLDEQAEQNKMHRAADYGVRIPVSDYRERLNLPGVEDDPAGALLTPPAPAMGAGSMQGGFPALANASEDVYRKKSLAQLIDARRSDLASLLAAVDALSTATDPDDFDARLQALEKDLENYLPDASVAKTSAALDAILGSALASGAAATFAEARHV